MNGDKISITPPTEETEVQSAKYLLREHVKKIINTQNDIEGAVKIEPDTLDKVFEKWLTPETDELTTNATQNQELSTEPQREGRGKVKREINDGNDAVIETENEEFTYVETLFFIVAGIQCQSQLLHLRKSFEETAKIMCEKYNISAEKRAEFLDRINRGEASESDEED